jgi:hypothetical protein
VAQPYRCIDELLYGDTTPCGWLPLIHLGYQLGLAPDDSAPARREYTFTVTGRVGAPGSAAKLAGLRAWTSVDGGAGRQRRLPGDRVEPERRRGSVGPDGRVSAD